MRFLTNGLKGREPLLIDPAVAAEHAALAEKFGFTDLLSKLFGEAPKTYTVEGADGSLIGVVPLRGIIGKALGPLEKMAGAVDVNDVAADIDALMAQGVDKIAFDVNSPGGTVTGVEELANKVRRLGVPTMAYTDTTMASAAYWIGSAADRVVVSPSSDVGSIGVYSVYYDVSKAYEAEGIVPHVYKAGKHKAIGIEGAPITEEQDAYLQQQVEEIWADFKANVKQKRKLVAAEDMEAQVYSGRVAANKGLATGLADSFAEALAKF